MLLGLCLAMISQCSVAERAGQGKVAVPINPCRWYPL